MQELSVQEMDQVSGAILPLIGFGIALVSKVGGATSVVAWAASSAGLILATYEAAKYLGNIGNSEAPQ